MTNKYNYHAESWISKTLSVVTSRHNDLKFFYDFQNFFHPFIEELIQQLNKNSIEGLFDPVWQQSLDNQWNRDFFKNLYHPVNNNEHVHVDAHPKEIDVTLKGPYANYNWELFFHIPVMIAVHLSKNQRFPEAQRWFHYVWNPIANVTKNNEYWNFKAFRNPNESNQTIRIEDIVAQLSTSMEDAHGYLLSLNKPFQPHVVARTRLIAYQYNVVMKYLDNLIAWGDHLFQQDTIETINEATQIYVLAANILGKKPQKIPQSARVKPKSFDDLRKNGLGTIGNAYVDLEAQFPLNFANLNVKGKPEENENVLFGIGRTLYFCIPPNAKMLGYWDTVADRLYKIRHCMNIAGIVRPLALFDPPIDPGMLVKAAAAGIDISSIVSGLNKPVGPVRSLFFIQKTMELCNEVRSLGNTLLSVLEKGDAEHIALLRQSHEIKIQQMTQDVRFLQWKQTQESTTSLLRSRAASLERLKFYKRLLGLPADPNAPDTLKIDHVEKADDQPKLSEENFDEFYGNLVGQYDKTLTLQQLSKIKLAGDSSPGILSGFSGNGKVYLSKNEDTELNVHLPFARNSRLAGSTISAAASAFLPFPDTNVNIHFWGLGGTAKIKAGTSLYLAGKTASEVAQIIAGWEQDQAGMNSKYASYERRADEWILQHNLACHELMQNGRQILTSLIAEQLAHKEYLNLKQQIANSQEIDLALHDKFTQEDLYLWMQGEISRLYYEYYRFAFDTARKAEKMMKQELMRPELDKQDFIRFNYWDGGRKGLLSGEALYLDVKKMEMAYHENNKREIELTKHVSLRQLNPIALLTLKATGSCHVTIPEWVYDMDCPGHYMRRIKNVSLSIPCITGPYTSVNCTLSLLKSTIRHSSIAEDYGRQSTEDNRFIDFSGAIQSIVTSSAQNDTGMFETNLRDERFLPFEGAGAESTWKLDLPKEYRTFNYDSISDVILHIRYTSRQGIDQTKVTSSLDTLFQDEAVSDQTLLFSLKHDFSNEWFTFQKGTQDFSITVKKDFFPYYVKYKKEKAIKIAEIKIYGEDMNHESISTPQDAGDLNDELKQGFKLTIEPSDLLTREANNVFIVIRYTLE